MKNIRLRETGVTILVLVVIIIVMLILILILILTGIAIANIGADDGVISQTEQIINGYEYYKQVNQEKLQKFLLAY